MKIKSIFLWSMLFFCSCASAMHNPGALAVVPRVQNYVTVAYPTSKLAIAVSSPAIKTSNRTSGYEENKQCALEDFLSQAADAHVLKKELSIEFVSNQIDKKLLATYPDRWFGSLWSYYENCLRGSNLNKQSALEDLAIVESFIPVNPQLSLNEFYCQLAQRHWYVNRLIRTVIDYEVEALLNVQGSTIDTLLNEQRVIPGLSQSMSASINKCTHNKFKELWHKSCNSVDIHVAPFIKRGCNQYAARLENEGGFISALFDGKGVYVDSIFEHQAGEYICVCGNDLRNIHSKVNVVGVAGKNDLYYSRIANPREDFINGFIEISSSHKDKNIINIDEATACRCGLILYVKPTFASRLLQIALINSRGNAQELIKLRDCKSVKDLSGFFLKKNLKDLIDGELKKIDEPLG